MASFNGLGMHLGNLPILSKAESRSISPENPTGEKGKGAMATPDAALHVPSSVSDCPLAAVRLWFTT